MSTPFPEFRRIERLRIRNYRALKDVTFENLAPVTALLGPNGSGKTTVFDAIGFLRDAITSDLPTALGRRGGIAELRTRGSEEPIGIEFGYWDQDRNESVVYQVEVDEEDGSPVVVRETLTPMGHGAVIEFARGAGSVVSDVGTADKPIGTMERLELDSSGSLAVGVFGRLAQYRRAVALRQYIAQLRVSNLDVERIRVSTPDHTSHVLSPNGDNLAYVIERMRATRPEAWDAVIRSLRQYVPVLEDVVPEQLGDGRWILLVKETGVDRPILADNVSDGTLKLLGYLVGLRDRAWALLLEEPENHVHPKVHYMLAEDIRTSVESGQVLVATHSPHFVNALYPEEVWMLYRDEHGYTQARRAADLRELMAMVDAGGLLGSLWTEGFFGLGDPLTRSGRPR